MAKTCWSLTVLMLPERPSGPWIDPSREPTKLVRTQAPASRGWMPVELDQLGVTDRTPLAAAPIEDQLHRAIVARIATWTSETTGCGTINRMTGTNTAPSMTELLRLPAGPVDLAELDPAGTPGFSGKKADAAKATEALAPELGDLQERLYAAGRVPDAPDRNILVILQGMDTSGKGGVIRHAIGMVDPQGIKIKSFRAPTEEERRHPYLWRIEREVPPPGMIGIFDRSQYEDVLVVRVNQLVAKLGVEQALRRDQRLRGAAGRRAAPS